jgi:hypothetical protein
LTDFEDELEEVDKPVFVRGSAVLIPRSIGSKTKQESKAMSATPPTVQKVLRSSKQK